MTLILLRGTLSLESEQDRKSKMKGYCYLSSVELVFPNHCFIISKHNIQGMSVTTLLQEVFSSRGTEGGHWPNKASFFVLLCHFNLLFPLSHPPPPSHLGTPGRTRWMYKHCMTKDKTAPTQTTVPARDWARATILNNNQLPLVPVPNAFPT